MPPRTSPTVRRRRLAAELKRLRIATGMTIEQAAKQVDISKSSLSRIESTEVSVQVQNAKALLELYGVDEADIEPLLQIAREARKRGWWHKYSDVLPDWFEVYVGLEAATSEINKYEPALVPGLLQTADYTRAIIRAEHPNITPAEVNRRTELRMQRQQHDDEPPRLWVVLDEAVIRRPVAGRTIMKAQLEHLIEAAGLPGNEIQVLAFAAGEHGSMGSSFSILRFPDPRDTGVVYLEMRAGSLYLEELHEIEQYTTLFNHLRASALGLRESLAMMKEAARAL